MVRPIIAYVDEQADERDNFYADAYDSGLFDEIHLVQPGADLDGTVSELIDLKIDALVSDFNLTDAGPLNYSGEDLVSRFLSIRSGFPCFIRTSYEEDALKSSADVNRIYSKDISADQSAGRSLFGRVVLQIERHRRQMLDWQERLSVLLDIPAEERTAADVQTIIELDDLLEASMGNDQRVPKDVKAQLLQKRDTLADETAKLIAEMRRALGDEA